MKKEKKHKGEKFKDLKTAYNSLENPKKFYRSVLLPLVGLGGFILCMPFILGILLPIPLELDPLTFIIGGIVLIVLGVFSPYLSWKNKETDINGKMHFFITHLRVLAISDLSLKEIIKTLGGNKAYSSLGEEMRKISVLSDQWRAPPRKKFFIYIT